MAYNTTHPKWKGSELSDLDCGYNIKAMNDQNGLLIGTFIAATNKTLAVGECAALVRVKPGTQILGAELFWGRTDAGTCIPTTILAVGDPFCCGRLLGPISTLYEKGTAVLGAGLDYWGECSILRKSNTSNGDGCGIGYTYTCETDIVLTNLYNDGFAHVGGAPGAYTAGAKESLALTSGKFVLVLRVRQQ